MPEQPEITRRSDLKEIQDFKAKQYALQSLQASGKLPPVFFIDCFIKTIQFEETIYPPWDNNFRFPETVQTTKSLYIQTKEVSFSELAFYNEDLAVINSKLETEILGVAIIQGSFCMAVADKQLNDSFLISTKDFRKWKCEPEHSFENQTFRLTNSTINICEVILKFLVVNY